MALDIQIDYPSVEVIDDTRATSAITPYGVCIMIGSGTTSSNDKVLTIINDLTDFSTKVGDTSPSKKYVESFFTNLLNNGVRLYFYKVNVGATPAVAADFNAAVAAIPVDSNPGGIVISPEFFETITTAGDITSFATALDTFCNTDNESYWISIVDLPATIATMADAVTAKNLMTSPKGNLIVYQPWYYKSAVKLLPSAAMAAICLSIWSGGNYSLPPAGTAYPIKDATALGYTLSKANLATAHSSGINAIRYFPQFGYIPYDTITISDSVEYFQINSVVCFKIVFFLVEREMLPFVHSPIAGDVEIMAQVEAALNRILNACWESGYLAGDVQADAFDVKATRQTLPPPNNAQLIFECAVRPSYALQKIKIYLKNTLGQAL